MSEQLPLVEVDPEPRLTDRQQLALTALQDAGADGLHADEVGARLHEAKQTKWAHSREERCVYCAGDGLQVLRRLRELGLARYRAKGKMWQAVGVPEVEVQVHSWDGVGPVPYNVIPY
jgi:hypothetical protein